MTFATYLKEADNNGLTNTEPREWAIKEHLRRLRLFIRMYQTEMRKIPSARKMLNMDRAYENIMWIVRDARKANVFTPEMESLIRNSGMYDPEGLKKVLSEDKKGDCMVDIKRIKKAMDLVNEAGSYPLYHQSYTAAVQTAIDYAERQGYTTDPDERFDIVGLGPRKPSNDQTVRLSIPVYKSGKKQRKQLQIQVYNRGIHYDTPYELNCYVS